jgi:hypothetical protein
VVVQPFDEIVCFGRRQEHTGRRSHAFQQLLDRDAREGADNPRS